MSRAVNAAALQDHLIKQLKKSRSTSLAQKLGLVPGPPGKMTEADWASVKASCVDPAGACPICLEKFRDKPQVILPCAHVYHRGCFFSFRRVTDNFRCPMCRTEISDFTDFDGGLKLYRGACATKIQAFFRGAQIRGRLQVPKGSILGRAKTLRKLKSISSRVEAQAARRFDFVASFLAAVEHGTSRNLKEIRISLRTLAELASGENALSKLNTVPSDSKWSDPLRACLDRNDKECSICFEVFRGSAVSLLSCSHVFHDMCIANVEDFVRHDQKLRCPVCREEGYERIALNDLVNY